MLIKTLIVFFWESTISVRTQTSRRGTAKGRRSRESGKQFLQQSGRDHPTGVAESPPCHSQYFHPSQCHPAEVTRDGLLIIDVLTLKRIVTLLWMTRDHTCLCFLIGGFWATQCMDSESPVTTTQVGQRKALLIEKELL